MLPWAYLSLILSEAAVHVTLLSLNAVTAIADVGIFLLTAMGAHGHTMSTFGCRGLMRRCVFNRDFPTQAEKDAACTHCIQIHVNRVTGWPRGQAACHWADSWLAGDEAAEWESRLAGLSLEEILALSWRDWPLGRWLIPALRVEWVGENWWELPNGADKAREWFLGAVRTALAFERFVEAEKPDAVLIYDGLLPSERLVWAVARQRGLRCVLYGVGQDPATIVLRDDKPVGLYDFSAEWPQWRDVPLSETEAAALDAYLAARRGAGPKVESSFSPAAGGDLGTLQATLGLQPGVRPVVTVLPGVAADYVFDLTDRDFFADGPAFETTAAWLEAVVAVARRHPDADVIIRSHPAEPSYRGPDTVASMLAEVPEGLPANVRVLPPESPVSTYDLLGLTDLVLVYHSTTGMEAAAMGLPVLSAGQPHYRDAGFVWHTTDAATFHGEADRLIARPEAPADAAELARRYLYFWFMRTDRRATMLRLENGTYNGHYQQLSWLGPRRDPVLDDLCAYMAGEGPFIRPPQPVG